MNTANKLLDKYAAICLAKTDSEIAEKLRVTKSAVSNWRREKAHPDEATIEKMAEAIGEPVGPWLIAIQAERTHDARNRKVWLRHATTLGLTLALVIVTLPSRVHAMTMQNAMRAGSSQFDISKIDILVALDRFDPKPAVAFRFAPGSRQRFRAPRRHGQTSLPSPTP